MDPKNLDKGRDSFPRNQSILSRVRNSVRSASKKSANNPARDNSLFSFPSSQISQTDFHK